MLLTFAHLKCFCWNRWGSFFKEKAHWSSPRWILLSKTKVISSAGTWCFWGLSAGRCLWSITSLPSWYWGKLWGIHQVWQNFRMFDPMVFMMKIVGKRCDKILKEFSSTRRVIWSSEVLFPVICASLLSMAEILHHLGCIKPCKLWDKLPINWCKISAINCIIWFCVRIRIPWKWNTQLRW